MYLRCSITDRCNLRCRYCLPEGVRFARDPITTVQLQDGMAAVGAAVHLDKIRITGGEPTLHPDCVDMVAAAKRLVPTVGMTSNGVHLEPLLPALQDAGLDLLNISLDGASEADFREVTRREGFAKVLSSIRAARALGFAPLKLNVVAMRSTDVVGLVELARWEGVHIRFIELMAIGEAVPWHDQQFITATELQERLYLAGISLTRVPDDDLPTSRVWHVVGSDPSECTVGFITTVTQPFCSTCDRLRLTSQGTLHTCLFDEHGTDLRQPLESGNRDELIARIRHAVAGKRPPDAFLRHGTMAAIGG